MHVGVLWRDRKRTLVTGDRLLRVLEAGEAQAEAKLDIRGVRRNIGRAGECGDRLLAPALLRPQRPQTKQSGHMLRRDLKDAAIELLGFAQFALALQTARRVKHGFDLALSLRLSGGRGHDGFQN